MKPVTRGLFLIALGATTLVAPPRADAFEAFCRTPSGKELEGLPITSRYSRSDVVTSICAKATTHECADGLDAARGWMMGEHRYITEAALRMLGLATPEIGSGKIVFSDPLYGVSGSVDGAVLDYFVDGQMVDPASATHPDGGSLGTGSVYPRMTPGGPAGMLTRARRSIWTAEFAEVPDGSHSLSDFVMGNETCLPPAAFARYAVVAKSDEVTDRDKINACHSFRTHMGAINSSHFGSQAGAIYLHYHRLAKQVAKRCADIWSAQGASKDHPGVAYAMQQVVPACEREAFALEAMGAHYMEDLWSTGHMWERWGDLRFGGDPSLGPANIDQALETQLRAQALGMVAGMQHGWRYIAQRADQGENFFKAAFIGATRTAGAQHDQLSLAGPPSWWAPTPYDSPSQSIVQFSYGDRPFVPQPGGGDLYLLACNARVENDPTWAIMGASTDTVKPPTTGGDLRMTFQMQRMLSCVALGFDDVYSSGLGKRSGGTALKLTPPPTGGLAFDPELLSHRGEELLAPVFDANGFVTTEGSFLYNSCLGQRVTNKSMVLGEGITDWGDFQSLVSRAKVSYVLIPGLAMGKAKFGDWAEKPTPGTRYPGSHQGTPLARLEADLATDLVKLAFFKQRAAAAGAPDKTDLADLSSPQVGSFLGFKRNPAAVPAIVANEVAYLENDDMSKWSATQVSDLDCGESDTFCQSAEPAAIHAGTFCDKTYGYEKDPSDPSGGFLLDSKGKLSRVRRCVRHEAAVLRAFRTAELPYWCKHDTTDDLEAARATCQQSMGSSTFAEKVESLVGPSEPCEACARMLLPHVRGSCNANAFATSTDKRLRSMCDVLADSSVGGLTRATLDATSIYLPYDPKSSDEALQAARFACLTQARLPFDSSPSTAKPAGGISLIGSGGSACFSTCDTCTTCFNTGLSGSLEYHEDVVSSDGRPLGGLSDYYAVTGKLPLFGSKSDVVDVALGYDFACAARADGSVWCSGQNTVGQLGIGTKSAPGEQTIQAVKVALANILHLRVVGPRTTCAIDDKGVVSCWGANDRGQIGDGTTSDATKPFVALSGADEIAAQGPGVCARIGGTVSCWGLGASGKPTPPTPVAELSDAKRLIEGSNCVLGSTGMECWRSLSPACPTPPCCPNVIPVVLPSSPQEAYGGAFDSLAPGGYFRGADRTVYAYDSLWPQFAAPGDKCPASYKPVSLGVVMTDADAMAGTFARRGNSLFRWYAGSTAGPLPTMVVSEAPTSCK